MAERAACVCLACLARCRPSGGEQAVQRLQSDVVSPAALPAPRPVARAA